MNKTTATHKAWVLPSALNIISFAGCCPSFCFFLLFPTSCWDMQHSGKRHKDAAHASSCQPVCLHFFKPRTYLQVHAVICVPHKKRTIHKLTVCHLQLYGDHMTAGCFAYRYLNSQKSPTDRSTVLRELDLRLILYLPLCLIMSLCYPDYNNLVIIKKRMIIH